MKNKTSNTNPHLVLAMVYRSIIFIGVYMSTLPNVTHDATQEARTKQIENLKIERIANLQSQKIAIDLILKKEIEGVKCEGLRKEFILRHKRYVALEKLLKRAENNE